MSLPAGVRRLLYNLAQLYFLFINFIFWLFNELFAKKEYITRPKEEILLLSVKKLTEKIRKRELTSSQVLEAFIRRTEEINAVCFKGYDEARETAKNIDARLSSLSQEERDKLAENEPLLGVPISAKDNYNVKGWKVTDGSVVFKDHVSEVDAEAIARVRRAGGIPFVITNVPEVAFRLPRLTFQKCLWVETSNVLHGRTNNPYDLRRHAGGSSGGEGALIATCGSVAGLGNDLGGSIRIPAFINGIFGLKPSPGIVSLEGVTLQFDPTTFISQMAVAGPLCRHSEDLEIMFRVLGSDKADELFKIPSPPARKLRYFYMEGLRSPYVEDVQEDLLDALRKVEFEPVLDMPKAVNFVRSDLGQPVELVNLDELNSAVEIYLVSATDVPDDAPRMWDVISNFEEKINPWTEFPKALLGKSRYSPQAFIFPTMCDIFHYRGDRQKELSALRDRLIKRINDLLGDDGVLLFPAWPAASDFHNAVFLKTFNFVYTGIFNALLLPVAVAPIGKNAEGIPLSVQIVGPQRSEPRLIEVAKELERGFGGWSLPEH